jgi:hypothetical protein
MTKYKLDQWKEHITEWQNSGKTREVFCREKNVTVATFGYWRTKIRKIESSHPQVKDGFVRCNLPSSPPMGYTIEWAEGMKLFLPGNLKFQELAALVRALKNPQ